MMVRIASLRRKGGRRDGQFALRRGRRGSAGDRRRGEPRPFELGCNIEDSTCTILSGQFAMIS